MSQATVHCHTDADIPAAAEQARGQPGFDAELWNRKVNLQKKVISLLEEKRRADAAHSVRALAKRVLLSPGQQRVYGMTHTNIF
ncbi:hypothetical protein JCM10207_005527 [Rhodosporidiobolus poonsookiae]